MDAIYQIGEASVGEVLAKLTDPPTYSAVRTMIRLLEKKGLLRHRQVGTKYVYRPAQSRDVAKRSALRHLLQTFFSGSATDAVAAILHPSVTKLTDDDIRRWKNSSTRHARKGSDMTRWLDATIDSEGFLAILADTSARATVLLLLSLLISSGLRRQSAALRHRLWALTLVGLIALPFVSWLIPGWRFPVLPTPTQSAAASSTARPPASTGPTTEAPPRATPGRVAVEVSAPSPARAVPDLQDFARPAPRLQRADGIDGSPPSPGGLRAAWSLPDAWLAVWGIGAVAAGLPTLFGLLGNHRLRRRSRRVIGGDWRVLLASLRREFAIRRDVILLQGEASPIPLTWGVVRPVILLPEDAPCWPDRKRRLVLLHELAHIRRFDAGFQLAGRLAAVLYWFHPLVWDALHRLRLESEHACDDCVVLSGERATDYATQLLELARSVRGPRFSMNIAMARTNALEDRLRALFDETRSRLPLDRLSARLLSAGAVALVLGLAMVHPGSSAARPAGQTPADRPSPTARPAAETPVKATGRISGRVVRKDGGDAVGGAEVVLLPPPPKGQDFYIGKRPLRRVMADLKGTFTFDGLAPGRYGVWANSGKLTSRSRQARGEVVVLPESGQQPKPVELRLVAGVRVTVRVKEKATGKPIPDATVQPGWSDLVDDFKTDRDGQVQAQPLTPERWLLEVWADGFAKDSAG